jgi:hypothetical protein
MGRRRRRRRGRRRGRRRSLREEEEEEEEEGFRDISSEVPLESPSNDSFLQVVFYQWQKGEKREANITWTLVKLSLT